jgi:hypothetical protein
MPIDERQAAPPRLSDGRDPVAGALREARRGALPNAVQEAAAWRRLQAPAHIARPRWRMAVALAAGAAAALVLAQVAHRRAPMVVPRPEVAATPARSVAPIAPQPAPQRTAPPAQAVAAPEAAPLRLALAARPRPLPTGRAALDREATVEVGAGTVARASGDAAWVRVIVERGDVRLRVAKRFAGGPGFEVAAGPYRFRVLGTAFRVARGAPAGERDERIDLWVEEGRVAISRGGRALGVVEAGGHWTGRAAAPAGSPAPRMRGVPAPEQTGAATAAPPPASPAEGPAPPRARCADLAAAPETAREAVGCYLQASRGGGVAAETALYEVGRLRRDELDDAAGALQAFQLYRTRFPRGMLRAEVDLSIVELLPKVNRHREALYEIGRLLAQGGGRERGAELLMLRGNIYREVLEDFDRAERDYAAVEAARAPGVGEATFFRGVCLQALGRAAEARAAFQRYLATGPRRFSDEARRRTLRLPR